MGRMIEVTDLSCNEVGTENPMKYHSGEGIVTAIIQGHGESFPDDMTWRQNSKGSEGIQRAFQAQGMANTKSLTYSMK